PSTHFPTRRSSDLFGGHFDDKLDALHLGLTGVGDSPGVVGIFLVAEVSAQCILDAYNLCAILKPGQDDIAQQLAAIHVPESGIQSQCHSVVPGHFHGAGYVALEQHGCTVTKDEALDIVERYSNAGAQILDPAIGTRVGMQLPFGYLVAGAGLAEIDNILVPAINTA